MDESGRLSGGQGLCINIDYLAASPFAHVCKIAGVGTALVARALIWSKDVDLHGKAAIPHALTASDRDPLDNPAVAYGKMGFRTVGGTNPTTGDVLMEISAQDAEKLLARYR